jgi:hypothetical protein
MYPFQLGATQLHSRRRHRQSSLLKAVWRWIRENIVDDDPCDVETYFPEHQTSHHSDSEDITAVRHENPLQTKKGKINITSSKQK